MHGISESDARFRADFDAGSVLPSEFNHRAHLRLAYIHLAANGPGHAPDSFKAALQGYLAHHGMDPGKFHATLTSAWLQAVWYFMQRAGDSPDNEAFLERCTPLLDPSVMLTHYSREVLFGAEARRQHVQPDLEPIPVEANPGDSRSI